MKHLSLVALVLVLHGCVTSSSVSPSADLPPENGLVIVKMSSNNRPGVPSRYFSWLLVDQQDSSALSNYEIVLSRRGTINSGIYFGSLPAGRYVPVRMMSSGYNSSSWMAFTPDFGTFTVEAGRVTDLGHILVDLLYTNEVVMKRGKTVDDWLPEYTATYFPKIPQSVFGQDYLQWDAGNRDAGSDQTQYARMRSTSRGFLNPTVLSDGSVLLGSLLGPIKRWLPGDSLRYLDAGYQGSVDASAEIRDGVWLAGSEDGRVKITSDAGANWQDFGLRFIGRSVVDLHVQNDQVYATVIGPEVLSIHVSSVDTPDWQLLTSQPFEHNSWSGERFLVRSHLQGDHLVTTLPLKSLVVTNLGTGESAVRELPGKLQEFTLDADGRAHCVCTKSFGFAGFVSSDWGQTWTREPAKLQTLAYYIDSKTGYTVKGTSVLKTVDGGASWSAISELPAFGMTLTYIKKTSTLIATNGFDALVFSDDGGLTWRTR
ncbi:MAG: hypothetical protein AAGA84_09740 [Pseudomonadota bacterium]